MFALLGVVFAAAYMLRLIQGVLWGTPDKARALPDLWENQDDVMKKAAALSEAAAAMEMAAGTSLEALQGAMGPLGGACGGCHKTYRAPEN